MRSNVKSLLETVWATNSVGTNSISQNVNALISLSALRVCVWRPRWRMAAYQLCVFIPNADVSAVALLLPALSFWVCLWLWPIFLSLPLIMSSFWVCLWLWPIFLSLLLIMAHLSALSLPLIMAFNTQSVWHYPSLMSGPKSEALKVDQLWPEIRPVTFTTLIQSEGERERKGVFTCEFLLGQKRVFLAHRGPLRHRGEWCPPQ